MTGSPRLRAAVTAVLGLLALATGCSGDGSALDAGTTTVPSSTTVASTTSPSGGASTTTTAPAATTPGAVQRLHPEVLERRGADASVFTQGLELHDHDLYVSGGLYGKSSVRIVDPTTGEAREVVALDDSQFGEGLTVVDDEVIVLTWRENTALVLDAHTLEERERLSYDGEGWGLCDDGQRLVMSDGTATLQFRDRKTFAPTGSVAVTLDGQPVTQLNELECVHDAVWANVWQTDTIVRIDPATGRITATVDASSIVPPETRRNSGSVLNGIAYDEHTDTFLITGKQWPALFVVRFVPAG